MERWFITGVSSGIGRAIAEAALNRGDRVVGTVRKAVDLAPFEALGEDAHALLLDLDRTETAHAVATEAIALLGDVDVVVCNAARSLFGAIEETSTQEMQALFTTNLFGQHAVMRAFLPHFRARGRGRIVAISSGAGIGATPGVGVYSATKFALEGLCEALSQEVADFGIAVTLIEPGAIASRFISHGTQDVAGRMPAYAALSGGGKDGLQIYYETAASPASVADAVLAAMDMDRPPLRVPVGPDTMATIRNRAAALQALAD